MQRSTFAYIPSACLHPRLHRSTFVTPISPKQQPLRSVRVLQPCMTSGSKPSSKLTSLPRLAVITTAISAALLPLVPMHVYSAPLSVAQSSESISSSTRASHALSGRVVRVKYAPSGMLATTISRPALATVQSPVVTRLSAKSHVRKIIPTTADTLLHKLLKLALLAAIVSFIITAVTISVFWIIQDSLVYKPTKVWRGNPGSYGMPFFDDVSHCTMDGVEIIGWFIKQPPESFRSARTLIYFHGTDKNASFRLRKVVGLYEKCKCNILLLSYRGYGPSTGKPNERGVRIDAESAYEYLKSRGDVDVGLGGNLWIYGESLGGAVAVYFSHKYQDCINALVLENTFTSLLDMIKLEFPILGIFRYLSRNRWQSKKRIKNIAIPLLFLSGLKDGYIPPAMMRKMHALATKSTLKEFVEFENGTHNRTWTAEGFYDSVARFMDRVDTEKGRELVPKASQMQIFEGRSEEGGRFAATA
ncbi:unnamed protein product [Agarophyton chilense]|eukprot:gb/GEZJ01003834.1/.p1 GENE.gb/GEZJ01003834.1/~~gb/GEZJ01003834.1/.p1  ORF type:complete len:543 (-),score=34.27 gb/GEZJ01003834.1/:2259-3680(-)